MQTTQQDKQASEVCGFYKMAIVYLLSFMVWVVFWLVNDGPGGVDSTLLSFMAVNHLFLIGIHANGVFKSAGE